MKLAGSGGSDVSTFNILIRTGRSLELVLQELPDCDEAGLKRAQTCYNAHLGHLTGVLDSSVSSELQVLCQPLGESGSIGSTKVAYAALAGWLSGLVAANGVSTLLAGAMAEQAGASELESGGSESPGTEMVIGQYL